MKTCSRCIKFKSLNEFPKDPSKKDGTNGKCKECAAEYSATWRKNNPKKSKEADHQKYLKMMKNHPEKKHDRDLRYKYGITLAQFKKMVHAQNGRCKICLKTPEEAGVVKGQPKRLFVDHCHLTHRVRGLLCRGCNLGIGQFEEDLNTMNNAIEYLTEHLIKSEF